MVKGFSWGLLALLIGAVLVFWDANKLRNKGVPIRPGIVVSILVAFSYLLYFSFDFVEAFGFNYAGNFFARNSSIAIQQIYFLFPFLVYLVLRKLKYQKIAKRASSPLPPSPLWTLWLMAFVILSPVLFVLFEMLGAIWFMGPLK